ncbi:MAG: hypothetical protein ABEH81_03985 [Halopenitus sp.]
MSNDTAEHSDSTDASSSTSSTSSRSWPIKHLVTFIFGAIASKAGLSKLGGLEQLPPFVDTLASSAARNPEAAAAIVATSTAWLLYGIIGKKRLGADDDFWEAIRARLLPVIDAIGKRYGLYAVTTTSRAEYAGYVAMSEDAFEKSLRDAKYLRQPLSSLHRNERGWKEDGSWARPHGMLFPIAVLLEQIPVVGGVPGRFLRAADTVFARRQTHIVFYTEQKGDETRIHVYCHDEANPVNPLTAFLHYTSVGFRASPELAQKHLAAVGVPLTRPGDGSR